MNSNTSVKKREAPRRQTSGAKDRFSVSNVLQKYGLIILFLLVLIAFGILKPDTFLTLGNVRNLLTTSSVTALLALGVMLPLSTGQFDLSVGYHLGLAHIIMITLIERHEINWILAALIVLLVGVLVGVINGILFTRFGVSSFIATLGTGMVLYGFSNFITKGEQIVGTSLPDGFKKISATVGVVPIPALIVLGISLILFAFLEYTVAGRGFFVVGSSPRAAELTGIKAGRATTMAFIYSGVLAGIAGIILASNLRSATASVGQSYLLPAFAGAMLGATSIKPGRMNVVGTVIAVLTLAFLFSGVQQIGAPFYVEYFFNGGILVIAVAASVFAAKRVRDKATEKRA